MKNLNFLFIVTLFISLTSCNKDEQKQIDESRYYDQDGECSNSTNSLCCDVDGRISVKVNKNYSYS